ncbi:MAG TPA: hypothetical protein VFN92_08185 [Solirubrobacterales bacterium]|nr:hypothetical protein [Solirubrobacterales bacterium]
MTDGLLLLIVVGVVAIAHLFAGVYTTHRQACRSRRRRVVTAAIVAVHRHTLAENRRVMGGSGGRR